jgi:hypothetical protein
MGNRVVWLCAVVAVLVMHRDVQSRPADLIVIGTVHDDQPGYTVDSLVAILREVRPDVLLLEGDPMCLDKNQKLREPCSRGLEGRAVTAHVAKYCTPLRACDMDGLEQQMREQRIMSRSEAANAEVGRQLEEGKLDRTAQALVNRVIENQRVQALFSAPRQINSSICDSLQKWGAQLGDSILAAAALSDSAKRDAAVFSAHWSARNKVMSDKAVQWAKQFAGKRLVLLCGYSHRWSIREALIGNDAVVLREYWEFGESEPVRKNRR